MSDQSYLEAPDLFTRIAAGDEAAFRQLVDIYAPRLQAMAARITGSVAVADDLVQDTFLKIWISRDQLPALQNPGAWVRKICFFLAVNYARRQNLRDKVMDNVAYTAQQAASGMPAHELADFHQLLGLVNTAVQQLPEKQRHIYRLSREQGLPIADIATQTDLAVSTVKNLLVMALKNIRVSLHKAGYPMVLALLLHLLI